MTKTRIQFLVALFLIVLPVLGFPASVDMVLVSIAGFFIAVTTFLMARERRMKVRLGVSVEPIKKQKRNRMSKKATSKIVVDEETEEQAPEETESEEDDESLETDSASRKKHTRVASPIFTETSVNS